MSRRKDLEASLSRLENFLSSKFGRIYLYEYVINHTCEVITPKSFLQYLVDYPITPPYTKTVRNYFELMLSNGILRRGKNCYGYSVGDNFKLLSVFKRP